MSEYRSNAFVCWFRWWYNRLSGKEARLFKKSMDLYQEVLKIREQQLVVSDDNVQKELSAQLVVAAEKFLEARRVWECACMGESTALQDKGGAR
jgi:hypothetical protein